MVDAKDAIAFVLVGGLGTRLRSVIGNDVPKPLALIDGEPFLKLLLKWLSKQGIQRVVLGTGHLAEEFERQISEYAPEGMQIQFSPEPTPLGTGGAIRNALPLLTSDPVLIMNGDSIINADLRELMAIHADNHSSVTMALAHVSDTARFGTVIKNREGRVTAYREKTGEAIPGEINAGMYVASQAFLNSLPSKDAFSFEDEILAHCDQNPIYAKTFDSEFIDIGTPESYRQASDFFRRFL